jgi:Flp pilus assembly protein TadG
MSHRWTQARPHGRALLRRVRRDEQGGVVAMVAASMIALFAMGAFVLDVGQWYLTHRQLQSAADAAALAAAQDLPNSPATAQTDATTYVSKNISGATVTVTTPYQGSSNEIQVKLTKTVSSIFGGAVGLNSVNVTASAAATKLGSTAKTMVFASDTACSPAPVTVNGNNSIFNGGVHSNGYMLINSNNTQFNAPVTYGGPNTCNYTDNGNNNQYQPGDPSRDAKQEPWPVDYSSLYPSICTLPDGNGLVHHGDIQFNNNNTTIQSGVWCSDGQIAINGNSLSGNVTFIAKSFNLSGNSENFTPYSTANGLLFYQTGSTSMVINGNSFVNNGSIFCPNGPVVFNANSGTVTGFLEAKDVTITGNNTNFVGSGPPVGGNGGTALTQ